MASPAPTYPAPNSALHSSRRPSSRSRRSADTDPPSSPSPSPSSPYQAPPGNEGVEASFPRQLLTDFLEGCRELIYPTVTRLSQRVTERVSAFSARKRRRSSSVVDPSATDPCPGPQQNRRQHQYPHSSRHRRRHSFSQNQNAQQPPSTYQPHNSHRPQPQQQQQSHSQHQHYQSLPQNRFNNAPPPAPIPSDDEGIDDHRPAKRMRLSEAREPPTPAAFESRRNSSGIAAALAARTPLGLSFQPVMSGSAHTNGRMGPAHRYPWGASPQRRHSSIGGGTANGPDAAAICAAVSPPMSHPRARPSTHVVTAATAGPLSSHKRDRLPCIVMPTPPSSAHHTMQPTVRTRGPPLRTPSKTPPPEPARRYIASTSAAPVFQPGLFRKPAAPPRARLSRRENTVVARGGQPNVVDVDQEADQARPVQVTEGGGGLLSCDLNRVITVDDLRRRNAELHGKGEIPGVRFREEVNELQRRLDNREHERTQKDAKLRGKEARLQVQEQIRAEKERELLGLKAAIEASTGSGGPEQPKGESDHWDEVYWVSGDEDWYEEDADGRQNGQVTVAGGDGRSCFAPLTEAAMKRLRRTMADYSNEAMLLAEIDGCQITGETLRRLKPNCWLNDEIVNAYALLLEQRSAAVRSTENGTKETGLPHGVVANGIGNCVKAKDGAWPKMKIMNSFFYSKMVERSRTDDRLVYNYQRVRRWTRRFDSFALDLMLIPINEGNLHWTLGMVDFRNKTVAHLDSLDTSGGSSKVRANLLNWVADEARDKNKLEKFDRDEWQGIEVEVPQQSNTDDCGVFLCKFADFLSRGWTRFTFTHMHMRYFRSRIAHELLVGKVL